MGTSKMQDWLKYVPIQSITPYFLKKGILLQTGGPAGNVICFGFLGRTARRLSWIKVAYFVRSNHEIYYIYQDENSWKLTKIQDLKDPVRWLMQEGGTSTNPHVDFHQLQTDSKFFTYVTKTRVNLNTYSRKPGN